MVAEEKHQYRLTDEQRNSIVFLRDKGLENNEIANTLGFGSSTVRYTLRAYDRVKSKDYEAVKNDGSLMRNVGAIQWACRKNGINPDKFIERLVNGEIKEEEAEKNDKQDASASDIEDAIHVAAKLMTAELQKTMQEQGEVLAKKLDQIATIIQSCCKNQMDKTNANADIAVKEYQKMNENLSWIRSQTKNLRYVK